VYRNCVTPVTLFKVSDDVSEVQIKLENKEKIMVERNDILLLQWHLCLIKADEQISPPSLVSKQTSHFQLMSVGILFNSTLIGIHLCKIL